MKLLFVFRDIILFITLIFFFPSTHFKIKVKFKHPKINNGLHVFVQLTNPLNYINYCVCHCLLYDDVQFRFLLKQMTLLELHLDMAKIEKDYYVVPNSTKSLLN